MAAMRALIGRGAGGRFLLGYHSYVLFCRRRITILLFTIRASENPHDADSNSCEITERLFLHTGLMELYFQPCLCY